MNILHILDSDTWGGIEQYVLYVCEEQKSKGNKTFVFCTNGKKTDISIRYSNVAEVYTFDLDNALGILDFNKILEIAKQKKIDVVNVHTSKMIYIALLLKYLLHIKVCVFKHNAISSKHDIYHTWQRKCVDAYICVSKFVYELQTRKLTNEERTKFHIVYNGININNFNKYSNQKVKNDNTFDIGFAGRMIEEKGIMVLLDAFTNLIKQYPDMRLRFAGALNNEYCKYFKKEIKDRLLEDKIIFDGLVTDMEKFYRSIDVLEFPSLLNESFGLVLCEALYCGIPVITSNSGAQSEIITNREYGEVVDAGDIKSLENALIKVYLNKSELVKYKDEREQYVTENFNIEKNVSELMDIMKFI